jgi:hypothetical protein
MNRPPLALFTKETAAETGKKQKTPEIANRGFSPCVE